jgi:hypothetical protein
MLLRQRGQNQKLANDIALLPEDSRERLFRILQDMENEVQAAQRKSRMYGHIASLYSGVRA